MTLPSGRRQAVDAAIAAAQKKHGDRVVNRYGDGAQLDCDVISSGLPSLDLALGVGGYPRGRIIEIYGPEASGKTTLTLHAIAMAQRTGHTVAFIDAEHALDPRYAQTIGVNMADLVLSQPDYGEQALDVVESLTQSGQFASIVIDSVAALVPKSELDGEMGGSNLGVHARLMSQAMRKLAGTAHKTRTSLFFINQIRMKIGVLFGSPETTTGGNALKYYASVRLDVRRKDKLLVGGVLAGHTHHVKVVKNKVAPPFQETDLQNHFGHGFDRPGDLAEVALALGALTKAGSWFSLNGTQLCQGRFKLNEMLGADPKLRSAVAEAVTLVKPQFRWVE